MIDTFRKRVCVVRLIARRDLLATATIRRVARSRRLLRQRALNNPIGSTRPCDRPKNDDVSNEELLTQIHHAVHTERHATTHVLALLIELDARRLYLSEGYSSPFTYCTQALHLAEHAAYNRIEAARAARRFPIILQLIEEGVEGNELDRWRLLLRQSVQPCVTTRIARVTRMVTTPIA